MNSKLSASQIERLALLIEEAAEVQQAATKILRHGYDSCHPADDSLNNQSNLEQELGDLQYAIFLMTFTGDISPGHIKEAAHTKSRRVPLYLHHQSASALIDLREFTDKWRHE